MSGFRRTVLLRWANLTAYFDSNHNVGFPLGPTNCAAITGPGQVMARLSDVSKPPSADSLFAKRMQSVSQCEGCVATLTTAKAQSPLTSANCMDYTASDQKLICQSGVIPPPANCNIAAARQPYCRWLTYSHTTFCNLFTIVVWKYGLLVMRAT